jgi:phage FluMu protein Com
MQTLTFQCGHCSKLMAVDTGHLGQQVRCPHCQQVVIAPAQPAPTSALPESARQEDPLAANPAASSPFVVAEDAPAGAKPETAGLEPPSEPATPPVSPNDPFGHLRDPRSESAPTTSDPAALPSWMADFEAPADEHAQAATTTPATQNTAIERTAGTPSPAVTPPPDGSAPWDAGPVPRIALPRARRSTMGFALFISLVFLPLMLYAILATILAVKFYLERGVGGDNSDPRQFLPDVEGEHPGFKHPKQSVLIPERFYTDPLPKSQRVAIGQTLTMGDLEIQPLRLEWRKVQVRVGAHKPDETTYPALVLHLRLRNTSEAITFYPLDRYFNREYVKGEGQKPLTLIEAGTERYYGGPAHWGTESQTVVGDNSDKPLDPGEEGEYFVCTNGYSDRTQFLHKLTGPFLWRVQLRRGLVHYRDKDLSATAIVGVEFTDQDIARAEP